MGARAGGTQAMVSALHMMHMGDALDLAMSRFYELGKKQGVLEVLRDRVERVPPREIERVARIEKLVDSRLDACHPPTAYRIQVLEAWPATQSEVELSTGNIEALEAELAQIRPLLEDLMLQAYRDKINY